MNTLACARQRMNSDIPKERSLGTTLYDLIEAISDEVPPGEEAVIFQVVLDLIRSGKVKWARSP